MQLDKRFLLVFLVVAWVGLQGLFAQGFYLKLNTAYQLGFGGSGVANVNMLTGVNGITTRSFSMVPNRQASGFNVGGALGYSLHAKLDLECGLNYFLSANTNSYTKVQNQQTGYVSHSRFVSYTRMLFINPAFVFKGQNTTFNPYFKLGAILGFGSIYNENNYDERLLTIKEVEYQRTKTSGGYSLGLQSALGLNYKLKDSKFSLFGELNFSLISFKPSYKELVVNTRNGANQMGTLSQSQKLVEYVKEHSYLNNANLSNTSRKEPIIHIPLSNFSLLVGVKYNFVR